MICITHINKYTDYLPLTHTHTHVRTSTDIGTDGPSTANVFFAVDGYTMPMKVPIRVKGVQHERIMANMAGRSLRPLSANAAAALTSFSFTLIPASAVLENPFGSVADREDNGEPKEALDTIKSGRNRITTEADCYQ